MSDKCAGCGRDAERDELGETCRECGINPGSCTCAPLPEVQAARALKKVGDAIAAAAVDLAPVAAAAAVAELARDGMDLGTRLALRAYVKKHHLMRVEDFERLSSPAIPPIPLHSRTPASEQPKQVCDDKGVCAAHPALALQPDITAEALRMVRELGVTGETRIIKATYLTVVSQVLPEPVSLVAKGTSAGGKSYSTKTTLRLFPEGDLYAVTAGSQRSLIYTDEDFDHRTIVMFEATALREVAEKRDGDMTAMIVRTLMSEGRLVYDVTEKDETGRMATRRITKLGPTNLIITTTADNLHQENETRLLSLPVDESEEQTRRVMERTAARRSQAVPEEPPDLSVWHKLFHWLKHHGEHRVLIPYAAYLAQHTAASAVRMRRDFNTLLGMIEAHAILHQLTRDVDEYGRIVATAADYDAARDILAEAFAVASGKTVKDSVRRVVEAVAELGGQPGPYGKDILVTHVAAHVRRDRTVATRGLKAATDLGYLDNHEEKQGRPARYRLGAEQLPDDTPALPDVLPADVCTRTPAQPAQLSPQVSDGCAVVQVCAGEASTEGERA